MLLVSLVAVMGLAAAHLLAGGPRCAPSGRRSIWLSLASGVAVAYVFAHLLPELAAGQAALAAALGESMLALERQAYLVALTGLVAFYGLERLALHSRREERAAGRGDATSPEVFWLHVASFAAYNLLIGYLLLHEADHGLWELISFAVAILLHFVVNDYGLREHHREAYARVGRWVLAAAVTLGWALGLLGELPEAAVALLLAFLAGGIVLNVLKEELPAGQVVRFGAFALGAATFAALSLAY